MTAPTFPVAQQIETQYITEAPTIDQPDVPKLSDFLALARNKNFSRTDRFMVKFNLPLGLMEEFSSETDVKSLTLMCEEAAFPGKIINPRPFRINGLTENRASTADYMGDSMTFQFLLDSTWLPRRVFERWMRLCVTGPESSREVGFYQDYISDISIFALVPALPQLEGVESSPTPSDLGARSGLGTEGSRLRNLISRGKRLANDQLDKLKSEAGSYTDPLANSYLKDAARILNIYKAGTDPNASVPAEKAVWGVKLHEAWPRAINVQQVAYNSPGFHKLNITFTYKYWSSDAVTDIDIESKSHRTSLLDRLSVDRIVGRVPILNRIL
jgi:hypothetical protein